MREHGTTTRSLAKAASWLWFCLLLAPGAMWAQTTTYHLHAAASSTPGSFQLQTAGPSAASVGFMSGPITVSGDYQVAGFDTQAGVPNTLGYFPTGSQISFSLWMQATKSTGAVYPEAKLFVNNTSGTLFCTGKSAAPLTTSLQPFNFSCTTTANVGLQTADRLYLWVGAAQSGMGSPTLRAKLSVEGTPGGNYDSLITVPPVLLVPQIAISPTSGGVGTLITITGTNLGDGSNSTVTLGGMTMPASWSNGSVTATVPLGAFSANVVLTLAGVPSNGVFFTDTSPSIGGLAVNGAPVPASIPPGTLLTISGANFGATQGSSKVTFSDGTTSVPGTVANNGWSNTAVTVAVPRGPTAGNVSVWITVNGTDSNGKSFVLQPQIDSLSASSGPVNSTLIIGGSGFGATQGSSIVTFNGMPVAANWSNSSLTVTVPAVLKAGNVNVVVTVNGLVSQIVYFTVVPGIVSLSSNAGAPGMEIVIEGTNFGAQRGFVMFGTSQATVLAWIDASISVLIPCAGSGPTTVQVTSGTNGLYSRPAPFTINLQ